MPPWGFWETWLPIAQFRKGVHRRQAYRRPEAEARSHREVRGGRKSHVQRQPDVVALARHLRRRKPKGGQLSLREISTELASQGHVNEPRPRQRARRGRNPSRNGHEGPPGAVLAAEFAGVRGLIRCPRAQTEDLRLDREDLRRDRDGWRQRAETAQRLLTHAREATAHARRHRRDRVGRVGAGGVRRMLTRLAPLWSASAGDRVLPRLPSRAVLGGHAVVGLSEPRENKTFTGLLLQERLAAAKMTLRCGLNVIDLKTGDVAHWLRLEGIVSELYDVVTLPGIARPMMIGFRADEIRRTISIESG